MFCLCHFSILGHAAQCYYATTWIYSPIDQKLDCTFIVEHPQNVASFQIGDAVIAADSFKNDKMIRNRTSVAFKKGWNQVFYRGYSVGYGSHCGMLVHGTHEQLWALKFSPTPQD